MLLHLNKLNNYIFCVSLKKLILLIISFILILHISSCVQEAILKIAKNIISITQFYEDEH